MTARCAARLNPPPYLLENLVYLSSPVDRGRVGLYRRPCRIAHVTFDMSVVLVEEGGGGREMKVFGGGGGGVKERGGEGVGGLVGAAAG